jgi:hypothetical protein
MNSCDIMLVVATLATKHLKMQLIRGDSSRLEEPINP